jgi:hypothetical protein
MFPTVLAPAPSVSGHPPANLPALRRPGPVWFGAAPVLAIFACPITWSYDSVVAGRGRFGDGAATSPEKSRG